MANGGVWAMAAWLFLILASTAATGAQGGAGPTLPLTAVTFNLFHGGPLSGLTGNGQNLDSRVLLAATLQTPWGPLRAFSTHTRGEPCQTRRVAELLRERPGRLPAVLMGDFNAAPDSVAITALTGEAGFTDAYGAANPTQPGPTVWQRIHEPVSTARRRVDYILVVPGTEFAGRVLASRLVLNAPRRLPDGAALWPSDHYGVLAEVDLLARNPSRAQSP
jgi:endonuclease/exonuclease/phosphatase family metal-dependent hydrolase